MEVHHLSINQFGRNGKNLLLFDIASILELSSEQKINAIKKQDSDEKRGVEYDVA